MFFLRFIGFNIVDERDCLFDDCFDCNKSACHRRISTKVKEEQQEEKQVDGISILSGSRSDFLYSWHSVFVHSGIFFLARYDLFFCFNYGWHLQLCFGVPGFDLSDFGSLRCYLSHLLVFCISKGALGVGQGTSFYWCFLSSTLEVALFDFTWLYSTVIPTAFLINSFFVIRLVAN